MAFREIGTSKAVRSGPPPLPGRQLGTKDPKGLTDTEYVGTNNVYGGIPPAGSYMMPMGPKHLRDRISDRRRAMWLEMGYLG